MTSGQRVAIASPAACLLVYDTDLDAFYYYTSGNWTYLKGSLVRDNYKLVKSIADLSDELAAGDGTQNVLNSSFLYGINGSASIAQVSFDGIGINVNPYTVGAYTNFNFTNDWYVESQGIP
ncbi:hypothetical protein [uncultured Winogradskyella sp.]|uniref:hypothetical protein n=1 Tax=uncultured Winogradskyella sp. TaxID=395353 RepID=UPI00262D30C1|nr:hypothetical protein [uncultured Winogradskyella sp.]